MAAVVVDEASKEEKSTPADAAAPSPTTPKPSPNPHEEIKAVARKFADNPLQNPDPGVWGVLTAISRNARQRPQGMNILLNGEEHCIGRIVADTRFQIVSINISANHCKIYRKAVACSDDELVSDSCVPVFLKDTSTNGTFVNWKKLRKRSPEARLQHGDIISFVAPPHEEQSYAFVYREVCKAAAGANGANLKRKSEDFCNESKRTKGIGIGAADGPVSLADVRSLQRSNTDLRKQLESHVATIETLRTEIRSSGSRHENEMKELKESISSSYIDQIMELRSTVDIKQKEVNELNTTSAELRSTIKDLNERLSASMQSRDDAHEIIQSQKARISELETQLDEERNQRREERENAAIDLKSALQRVQAEAQEEIKRQAEIYLRQNREQLEVISKLQDSEKESRILVDTLRSKLEDARENIVMSEKKVRQLETQVQEEHLASENNRERAENADSELKRLKKELEVEKVAREEAWAKVSALELEIAAAMHELSIEKQRFQGARERIILRETQLRAFYSTTEEITALFAKQQEQLKAMQKTLEDEENCENISAGFDLNSCPKEINNEGLSKGGDKLAHTNNSDSRTPGLSTSKDARVVAISSSDDTSATEKHNCDVGSQEEENTQDLECTSASKSIKGFGSDIDGVGTAPVHDGEALETEQVPETESPGADIGVDEHASLLQKCSTLAGDTMQLDDETHLEDNMEKSERPGDGNDYCSQTRFEDTEIDTVRTTDLLTSEVPGSWANSTAPSYHGENDSPKNGENDSLRNVDAPHDQSGAAGAAACFADGQAEESQTNVATSALARLSEEHRALNAMIEIVAPDLKDQFRSGHSRENESMSDAETEEGSNDNEGDSESEDDEDSPPSNCGDSPVVDEGNDDMIEDSVG